jgi:hypothetical protein
VAHAPLEQVMYRLGLRVLVAAAGAIGLPPAVHAQTAHAELGVSATVTRSCLFSTGGAAQPAIACTGGTSWTGSSSGRPGSAPAAAAKAVQAAASTDPSAPKILFVTISF